MAERFLRQSVNDIVLDLAEHIIDRHLLRAYDAMQLAGCLVLASRATDVTFVCSDRQLLAAARAENLPVFDPVEPPATR